MKEFKLFLTIIFVSFFGLIYVSSVQALNIFPPEDISNPTALFGQDHAYTVTFRGNGEAVVNLRVAFINTGEKNQSTVSFRVPRVEPKDIVAYQVIREPSCRVYTEQSPGEISQVEIYDEINDKYTPPECIEYDEPDYYNTYWYGNTSYKKSIVAYDADTITVTIPESIKQNESGSILLYFRSNGYTKKGAFGSYEYIFESLKTEDSIKNLLVGITTDTDLKLKNADSEVQYRFDDEFTATQGMIAESKVGVTNAQFDQYYQQIGQGSIVETATDLQPLESFTVEGAYADAVWKLYGKQIAIGIVVIVVLLGVVGYGIYRLVKYLRKRSKDHAEKDANNTTDTPAYSFQGLTLVWMVAGSFIASIFAAGYTVFIFLFGTYLNSWYYSEFNMLIVLFLLIVSFGIYPLLLFGPAIFIGMKRGLWWGVGTFALTLMWLVIYLFVLFGYMVLSRINRNYPYPQPLPYLNSQGSDVYVEKVEE